MTLREYTLSQMGISGITNKAISKHGLGVSHLINASISNNNLLLMFEVQSSNDDNKHVDLKGNFNKFLRNGYSVQVSFLNIDKILPADWQTRNEQEVVQFFKQIYNNCDVKVYCDCPAFYWQGMAEEDDKSKTSYFKFQGQPGKDSWQSRHRDSGGFTSGQQMCKHIFAVEYDIRSGKLTKDVMTKLHWKEVQSPMFDNILNAMLG